MNTEILMVVMGGTIDGRWSPADDTVVMGGGTLIGQYLLETIRFIPDFNLKVVTLLDSRQIGDSLRAALVDFIRNSSYQKVLITHGTFTLADTIEYIFINLGSDGRRIVATGSFYPLSFGFGDAGFNLGFALGALISSSEPGIFCAMHGNLFPAGTVRKDVRHALFTRKES